MITKHDVLKEFDGNKLRAAREIPCSRNSLYMLPDDGPVPNWFALKFRDYLLRTKGTIPRKWMPK